VLSLQNVAHGGYAKPSLQFPDSLLPTVNSLCAKAGRNGAQRHIPADARTRKSIQAQIECRATAGQDTLHCRGQAAAGLGLIEGVVEVDRQPAFRAAGSAPKMRLNGKETSSC
jgi:hypothetical protein